ncbi:RsmE family RNA methyltransferase [Candidatus Tisiphia endosymbiont of Metellina segmentata]
MLDAIDMAVQLGVTKIIPLIAERSQFRTVNTQRLMKCIIESTEQSERLIPCILMPVVSLSLFLEQTLDNSIIYANENEDENNTLLKIMPIYSSDISANLSVVVGPEGGFSQNELQMLSLRPNTLSISLGSNILRTETAVATCLAQIKLFTASCVATKPILLN